MSIVSTTYNQGTGLINPIGEGQSLPVEVDDLTVTGNLTVLQNTQLSGQTTVNSDLIVSGVAFTEDIINNNNLIVLGGIGQDGLNTFKLPPTNGTTDQILTITDDTANPILTEWKDPPINVNDYVQYDPLTEVFKRNFNLVITQINNLNLDNLNVSSDLSVLGLTELGPTTINDNLTVAEITTTDNLVVNNNSIFKNAIGQTSTTQFKLPINSAGPNYRLSILDPLANPMTTEWQAEAPIINEYIKQDGETLGLKNVISGIESPINDLAIRNIGYDILKLFKLPTNTPTTGQYLSITDATTSPPTTSWIDFGVILPEYVSYDNLNEKLINNALSTYNIDYLRLQTLKVNVLGQIGQLFTLPTNTSTATAGQVLSILDGTLKSTQWSTPSAPITDYTSYNTTSKVLINNVSGTPTNITDIAVTKIGATNAQSFTLPGNTSTATAGQILSILNGTTKTTQWVTQSAPVTNYASYNTTSKVLVNNVSGTPTDIVELTINNIGQAGQIFTLPNNTSSVSAGKILSILNASTKTTQWINAPPTITDYTSYDPTGATFTNNLNGTPTSITNIATQSIGYTLAQKFTLPLNTSTATIGQILSISVVSPNKQTQWIDAPPTITDYTSYNTTSKVLINNVSGTPTNITELSINKIGQAGQIFTLPNNTSSVSAGKILSILNASTKTTQWINAPPTILDYTSYDTTGAGFTNNLNGTPTPITNIATQSIGYTLSEKFTLPLNTSTATIGQILSISVVSPNKQTQWINPPPTITDYTSYNTTSKVLINNVSGTPTNITDLAVTKIGATNAQIFSLPTNTSTSTAGQVLSILDGTTKTTQWITPSAPITNYVTYNTTSNALVNNDSGSTTNISTLVLSDTLGISFAQRFSLPANTTTSSNNYVLSLSSVSFKTTQWVPAAIIPTTTETSITTAIATASGSTVEMCRATGLVAGTYIITYQVEPEILTTTRAFTYRSYGVSNNATGLTIGGLVGLNYSDSIPYTAPITTAFTPLRYSGSGVTVLTSTTTLYLLVRFNYTGTTFNTKGTMRVTKIA
jgi:hypothetical protein